MSLKKDNWSVSPYLLIALNRSDRTFSAGRIFPVASATVTPSCLSATCALPVGAARRENVVCRPVPAILPRRPTFAITPIMAVVRSTSTPRPANPVPAYFIASPIFLKSVFVRVNAAVSTSLTRSISFGSSRNCERMLELISALSPRSMPPASAIFRTPGSAARIASGVNPAIARKACPLAASRVVNAVSAPSFLAWSRNAES